MALGKSVGRISVRVIPDATKFRNDLQLLLKRVENSMSANIAVTADVRPFKADLNKLLKDANGKEVKLNVDAKTAGFTTHLRTLLRPRKLNVDLTITKKSAAKVVAFLAAFSGARVAGDLVKNLGERLASLDRDLPKIASVALGVASLSAAGLNAVHGIGGVAVGLGQLVPLAALLPGLLFGAAAGVATLVLAFKGAPKSITSALSAYKSLQGVVSKNFWADAAKPIRAFLTGILPQLKTGFAGLASEMGNDLANVATVLGNGFSGGVLAKVFSDARDGAAAALPGVTAFTHAFITLLTTGAGFLPAFGGWVSKIGKQFDGWLTGAEATGELNAMIKQALKVLGQLGHSVLSVGSILKGVFTAGGSEAIGGLQKGLAAIAKAVNSPTFQKALITIFSGAAKGASGLAQAIAPIGSLLSKLAPALGGILTISGQVVGGAFGAIAKALEAPVFTTGLNAFFGGITDGVKAVLPALPSVVGLLSSVGNLAGTLASNIGPVLSGALRGLSGALQPFLDYVTANVIPVLGPALVDAIKKLTPKVEELGKTLGPVLGSLSDFVVSVLPSLTDGIGAILDGFNQVGSGTDYSPILAFFNNIGGGARSTLGAFQALFDPDFWNIDSAKIDQKFRDGLYGPLLQTTQQMQDAIGNFFGILGGEFANGWAQIQGFTTSAFTSIGIAVGLVFKQIPNQIAVGFANALNGAIDLINAFAAGLNAAFAGLKKFSGGSIDLKLGKIPHVSVPKLAIGADIVAGNGGVTALLGEGGRNERVIDQGLGNKALAATISLAKQALAARGGAAGDGAAPQVIVHAGPGQDEREIGRLAGRELDDLMNGR